MSQVGFILKTISRSDGTFSTEDYYGVSSRNKELLPPKAFIGAVRGHWSIENSLHHVKDRSWYEDNVYNKDSTAGEILGTLRNLSLNVIRVGTGLDKAIKSMPKAAAKLFSNIAKGVELLRQI